MADETQKIICMPTDNSSSINPMLSALLSKDNGMDAGMMAMMNNNNLNNSPWMYLIFLALFGNGGFGFGGNRTDTTQNAEILNRINSLSGQMNTNQNTSLMMDAINGNHEALHTLSSALGVDFATLNGAIAGVQNAITQVGGQVGYSAESVKNAIAMGDSNIISKMQECCCSNKLLTQQMGYEAQLRDQSNTASLTSRIDQLANGITQGFAQIGYATQAQTNEIVQAGNANTQRLLDQMCANTTQELRDKLAELSQSAQTATIVNQLKGTCGCSN